MTITATLPTDIQSRAYSDGYSALDLWYAVYEDGVDTPIIALNRSDKQFSSLTNTLTLQLITGKKYQVVFWAQSPNAKDANGNEYFTLDTSASTITVNYANINDLNVEDVDAFFSHEEFTVDGAASLTSTLKRPFAQINVGTNDINEPAMAGKTISTTMEVSGVYSQFSLRDGSVLDTPAKVTFAQTIRPNNGLTKDDTAYEQFPVGTKGQYEYLAMAYVLMSSDKTTADIDLDFYDGADVATASRFHHLDVDGAPVQRNYRTNIFGALLTSTIDFTITINPDYDGYENRNLSPWDGKTLEPVTLSVNSEGTTVLEVSNGAQLAAVWKSNGFYTELQKTGVRPKNFKDDKEGFIQAVEAVKEGWGEALWGIMTMYNGWETTEVALAEDIDMGGNPLDCYCYFKSGNPITFNGNGLTISNMEIEYNDDFNYRIAMFWYPCNVKDLTINDLVFDLGTSATDKVRYIGALFPDYSDKNYYYTVENVHVDGFTITGSSTVAHSDLTVGGLFGTYGGYGTNSPVKNCSVKNMTTPSDLVINKAGGIMGFLDSMNGIPDVNNCEVDNINFGNANNCGVFAGYTDLNSSTGFSWDYMTAGTVTNNGTAVTKWCSNHTILDENGDSH